MASTLAVALGAFLLAASPGLRSALDRQDRTALENTARAAAVEAGKKPQDPAAQYRAAEAHSYLAEVSMQLGDKEAARRAAEEGVHAAERAVALRPGSAEYHRILGTLCGQIVPARPLLALKYGQCAREEIDRAVQLDPRSSRAYLARGVGNYYLPPAFGGGVELAMRDFRKALDLDPKSADAHLWLGIALRKANRNAEARKEIQKSLELNPNRLWARKQLEKTPAQ